MGNGPVLNVDVVKNSLLHICAKVAVGADKISYQDGSESNVEIRGCQIGTNALRYNASRIIPFGRCPRGKSSLSGQSQSSGITGLVPEIGISCEVQRSVICGILKLAA